MILTAKGVVFVRSKCAVFNAVTEEIIAYTLSTATASQKPHRTLPRLWTTHRPHRRHCIGRCETVIRYTRMCWVSAVCLYVCMAVRTVR